MAKVVTRASTASTLGGARVTRARQGSRRTASDSAPRERCEASRLVTNAVLTGTRARSTCGACPTTCRQRPRPRSASASPAEHLERLGLRDRRAQPPHALRRARPHRDDGRRSSSCEVKTRARPRRGPARAGGRRASASAGRCGAWPRAWLRERAASGRAARSCASTRSASPSTQPGGCCASTTSRARSDGLSGARRARAAGRRSTGTTAGAAARRRARSIAARCSGVE